jgi:endonuclease/exonuclease/phosphatase family metal-dependent hydrolase
LEILSYNIRYDNPEDGKNQWKFRKETLMDYFLQNTPDVVGMQEVLHNQLNDLTSTLEDYAYVGVGREDGKTKGEYSPVFYRKSALNLLESDTFWLSETPGQISVGWDAALERICTYARFEHRQTKKQLWVFNTHFDHVGVKARAEAANLILKKIKQLNPRGLPTVITGDFNLTPETLPIQIFQAAFEDVLLELPKSDFTYGTFTGFDTENNAERRIDYIFQKGFTVKKAAQLWIKTPEGRWASDHHPVYLACSF